MRRFLFGLLIALVSHAADSARVPWRPLPNALFFQCEKGGAAPAARNAALWTGTGGKVAFTAAVDSASSWLVVTPASGEAPASLKVNIKPGNLAPGTYQGRVTIKMAQGEPAEADVPVTLMVTDPDAYLTTTLAGRADRDTGPAWPLYGVKDMAADAAGNVYYTVTEQAIHKVGVDGRLVTVWSQSDVASPAANLIAAGPNGEIYFADRASYRVFQVSSPNSAVVVAGGGSQTGDGIPATSAKLNYLSDLAADRQGNLYILSGGSVYRVAGDGNLKAVIGGCGSRCARTVTDGAPATSVDLTGMDAFTVDGDGNFFVRAYSRLYKVSTDGTIRLLFKRNSEEHLAASLDGSLYLATAAFISRVPPGGSDVERIAGQDQQGSYYGTWFTTDQAVAAYSQFLGISRIAAGLDGNLYVADAFLYRVSRDQRMQILAGPGVNRTPALEASQGPVTGLTLDNSGRPYFANGNTLNRLESDGSLRLIGAASPGTIIYSVAVNQAGDIFAATGTGVFQIGVDRPVQLLAGGGTEKPADGLAALSADLRISRMALAPDGGIVILGEDARLWLIRTDGTLKSLLADPLQSRWASLAIGPDGKIYVTRANGVATLADGKLTMVAGGGTETPRNGLASTAITLTCSMVYGSCPLAFDAAGNLFIGQYQTAIRVGADGAIRLLKGIGNASQIAIDKNNRVYFDGMVEIATRLLPSVCQLRSLWPISFPCAAAPTASRVSLDRDGGTATVEVLSSDGCAWKLDFAGTWLSAVSRPGKTGTIELTAAKNEAAAPRSLTLLVNGSPIVVSQAGTAATPQVGEIWVDPMGLPYGKAAPDSIVAIGGDGLTVEESIAPRGTAVEDLAGTTVEFNGRRAGILWALPDYIACVVPRQTGEGNAPVKVKLYGMEVASSTIGIVPISPAIPINGEEQIGEADAFNAVTGAEPPFAVTTEANPGTDKRTRVDFHVTGIRYADGRAPDGVSLDMAAHIKIEAVDADGAPIELVAERTRASRTYPGMDVITIILPAESARTRKIILRVLAGGRESNQASIAIRSNQ